MFANDDRGDKRDKRRRDEPQTRDASASHAGVGATSKEEPQSSVGVAQAILRNGIDFTIRGLLQGKDPLRWARQKNAPSA
jgi:hypothetical protein